MRRQCFHLCKGMGGEDTGQGDPGNRRDIGPGTGSHDYGIRYDPFFIEPDGLPVKPAFPAVDDINTGAAGLVIEDTGDLCLYCLHLSERAGEIRLRRRPGQAELLEPLCHIEEPCHVIQGADRHAAEVEALTPDSGTDATLLDQPDVFSCSGKPYGCNPPGRATSENNNHGYPLLWSE